MAPSNSRKRIAIVIVNYRTPELVKDCLVSLEGVVANEAYDIQAYIGDAASGDGSTDLIQAFIEEKGYQWATAFDIGKNGGFAFGNNAIIQKHVLDDPEVQYVHFLNPDTYVLPGAVEALVDALDTVPRVGVVGSRLENPDGSWRAYAFRFPKAWREFFRGARFSPFEKLVPAAPVNMAGLDRPCEVDWVTGASFMVPRAVLDEVGLMDDAYFLYFEEVDFMVRIKAAGYAIWHVPESRVVHLAGQSTGVRPSSAKTKPVSPIWMQSRSRFFIKTYGAASLWAGTALFLAGDIVYRIMRILRGRPIENPPALWRSYLTHGFAIKKDPS